VQQQVVELDAEQPDEDEKPPGAGMIARALPRSTARTTPAAALSGLKRIPDQYGTGY
jgi:hypothetical protein